MSHSYVSCTCDALVSPCVCVGPVFFFVVVPFTFLDGITVGKGWAGWVSRFVCLFVCFVEQKGVPPLRWTLCFFKFIVSHALRITVPLSHGSPSCGYMSVVCAGSPRHQQLIGHIRVPRTWGDF